MANDLKPMLARVLASGGAKKFYFAYALGKRKDKKGDGELAVGGKKLKKPEIEGALDGPKDFTEGVCWVGKGPDDADTVYFQGNGKKLSQMVVAKMALTAKQLTGRQQDFQLPSPEEEARAAQLKEGEDGEAPTGPTPPPADKKAAEPAVKATAGDDPAAPWKARLAEWSPAIKAAMAAKGPNAADIAKLLAQATALSKPGGDMALALAKLTECHALATKATAASAAGATPADLSAKWKAMLEKWTPHLKAAMTAKGPNAADIAKLLAQATALSKPGGDMPQAIAKLTQCQPFVEADWTRRVTALEPKVLEAQKTRQGDAKWMAMFMTAQDAGGEDDFAKSFTILDKLEGLLNAKPGGTAPGTTEGKTEGAPTEPKSQAPAPGAAPEKTQPGGGGRLVKQRQFMLTRWARIPAELKVSVNEYKKRIVEEQADDNPEELSALMENYLLDLVGEIKDKLDDAINAGDTSAFAGLRASVAEDELLVHLASTPGMNGKKCADAILSAMSEIEAAMTA